MALESFWGTGLEADKGQVRESLAHHLLLFMCLRLTISSTPKRPVWPACPELLQSYSPTLQGDKGSLFKKFTQSKNMLSPLLSGRHSG